MEQTIPKEISEQYADFCSKTIRFSQMNQKVYHAMLHNFTKYGLHKPRHRKDALCRVLSEDEQHKRRLNYMREWRKSHPGWNAKHVKKWRNKQQN